MFENEFMTGEKGSAAHKSQAVPFVTAAERFLFSHHWGDKMAA